MRHPFIGATALCALAVACSGDEIGNVRFSGDASASGGTSTASGGSNAGGASAPGGGSSGGAATGTGGNAGEADSGAGAGAGGAGGATSSGGNPGTGGAPPRPYCNGRSGDLTLDALNCGKCGNICQPEQIAYGLNAPGSVIADSKYVYWAEHIASGRVFQVPLGGAATANPPVIARNQKNPHSLAVDATNVYWITDDSVWMRPVAGGNAVSIATDPANRWPGDVTLDGTSLYFTSHSDAAPNYAAVKKMPLGGGTAVELASIDVTDFGQIAVDATSVFWTDTLHDGSITSGRHNEIVYEAPLGGGTPVEVFRFTPYEYTSIYDMVADAKYLYLGVYVNPASITPGMFSESRVMRMPLTGGAPETIVTNLQQRFAGFGINSQGAFLASNNGNVVGGTIRSTPNAPTEPFALGWQTQPTSLSVTETHVYISAWEDNGQNAGTVTRIGLCANSTCQ